ncbi:MAG: rhodanese-like domain-containing protein [Acidimicrobiales bacterium]
MPIRSVNEMVEEAKQHLDNLAPAEAKRRVDEEGALVVDIRDVREVQRTGAMAGSNHAPRGMLEFWFDPSSPYAKDVFQEDREFILCCAAGWRSALAAKTLLDMGVPRVSHIETGFTGWESDGLPVVPYDEFRGR